MPDKAATYSEKKNPANATEKNTQKKMTAEMKPIVVPQMDPIEIIQRVRMNPNSLTQNDVIQLQRTIGNRAVMQLLSQVQNTQKPRAEDKSAQFKKGEEKGVQNLEQKNRFYVSPGPENQLPREGEHVIQKKREEEKSALQIKKESNVNDGPKVEKPIKNQNYSIFSWIPIASTLPFSVLETLLTLPELQEHMKEAEERYKDYPEWAKSKLLNDTQIWYIADYLGDKKAQTDAHTDADNIRAEVAKIREMPEWAQKQMNSYKTQWYEADVSQDKEGMEKAHENAGRIRGKLKEIESMPPWAQKQINKLTAQWYEADTEGDNDKKDSTHQSVDGIRDKLRKMEKLSPEDKSRMNDLTAKWYEADEYTLSELKDVPPNMREQVRDGYKDSFHRQANEIWAKYNNSGTGGGNGTGTPNPQYYSQGDSRWGDIKYSIRSDWEAPDGDKSQRQDIAHSGCGVTAMAMIVATLAEKNVTPDIMAKLSMDNGYRTYNDGTSKGFYSFAAKEYGINCIAIKEVNKLKDLLKDGSHVAIASMGPGHFTSAGHLITLTGITTDSDGIERFIVYDPNTYNGNYSKGKYKNDGAVVKTDTNGIVKAKVDVLNSETTSDDHYWVFSKPTDSEKKTDLPQSSEFGDLGKPVKTVDELINMQSDLDQLARAIYGECTDNGNPDGQNAVAWTMINRKYTKGSGYTGKSYRQIITAPSQYVALTEDEHGLCRHPNVKDNSWKNACAIAYAMLNNDTSKIHNPIGDRMHFFQKGIVSSHMGGPTIDVSDNTFFYWI